jgi:hypothetical protein
VTFDKRETMQASESEIHRMTRELDDLHHDVGMPAMRASINEWRDDVGSKTKKPTNRRTFLIGAGGVLAGGAALFAVGAPPLSGVAGALTASGPPNSQGGITGLSGDLAVAALAASLENLAVYAYTAGISAATAGKLGTVPPAVVTFATTAKGHHTQHGAAWNAILTASGEHAVTVTEPSLTPVVNELFAKVTDVPGLAKLALQLENAAAQTYQVQSTKLKSQKAIATSSSIQPVEMQHAAILYFALGQYPGVQTSSGAPLAFNPTSTAVS